MKKKPAGKTGATDPLAAVSSVIDGIKLVAECVRDIEKERTQQTKLQEDARIEVERIHAMRDVLVTYLEKSFDEREKNFRELFSRLDVAIEKNDVKLAGAVLDSVVKLADSSPFKALRDVEAARKAVGEANKVWDL